MDKIEWCIKQNKGIKLVAPSENISKDYIQRAEEDIISMVETKGSWKIIIAYYACYEILYSLLSKIGIKSEIHECSIRLMDFFDYTKEEKELIKRLKEERIQNQYYLKKYQLKDENKIKFFVIKTKKIITGMNNQKIQEIRQKIRILIEKNKKV